MNNETLISEARGFSEAIELLRKHLANNEILILEARGFSEAIELLRKYLANYENDPIYQLLVIEFFKKYKSIFNGIL